MAAIRPKVATNSEKACGRLRAACGRPAASVRRTWRGRSTTPSTAPAIWTSDIGRSLAPGRARCGRAKTSVTTGLKWAPGDRTEHGDQHHQARPGRQRVAEQARSRRFRRQPLAHDARADHDREQEGTAQRSAARRWRAANMRHAQAFSRVMPAVLPMSSSRLLQRQLVKLGQRQAGEDGDAVVEHAIGVGEGQARLGFGRLRRRPDRADPSARSSAGRARSGRPRPRRCRRR